jgi:hypothetical protein
MGALSRAGAAPPCARTEEHEPIDDPNQNNDACGGPRAPSEAVTAPSRSRRCARASIEEPTLIARILARLEQRACEEQLHGVIWLKIRP